MAERIPGLVNNGIARLSRLEGFLHPPTTMTKIQNRLHEMERPVRPVELSNDLGIDRRIVSGALNRLVKKGIVVRHRKRVTQSGALLWKDGVKPRKRVKRIVWVYEISTED